MKLNVLCQVNQLKGCSRYPLKPGSTDTDYSKDKEAYTVSTIKVLPNGHGIEGYLDVEGELRFGQLVKITINTEQGEVVEDESSTTAMSAMSQGVAAAMAAVDRVEGATGL